MSFIHAINKDCICILSGNTKKEVLLELTGLLAKTNGIQDVQKLKDAILRREELMSTGIGLGVAIPHVRIEDISNPAIAIGLSADGINDYESIDDKKIWLIIMIIAGKTQHREYIRLMAEIIQKLKSGDTIEKLRNARTSAEIYNTFMK